MNLLDYLCIIIALILFGAAVGKPLGWIAMGFAVLALVVHLLGYGHLR
jgi:hypothetical protein